MEKPKRPVPLRVRKRRKPKSGLSNATRRGDLKATIQEQCSSPGVPAHEQKEKFRRKQAHLLKWLMVGGGG